MRLFNPKKRYEFHEDKERFFGLAMRYALEYVLNEKEDDKTKSLESYSQYLSARLLIRKIDHKDHEKAMNNSKREILNQKEIDALLAGVELGDGE